MPVFEYQGFTGSGKKDSGYVDADSPQAARQKLRNQGIFPTEIRAGADVQKQGVSRKVTLRGRVKIQDQAVATRQLSTLVAAGIPLVESLTALIDQIENTRLKTVLGEIREKVNQGGGLGDSMALYPKIYSNLYINMVRAGEASGTLDLVLDRLADFTENQMKLKNRIVSVMAYPALMTLIGFVILLLLFTYVIPKVTELYENFDQALPLPTQILIGVSDVLVSYWWALILVVTLVMYVFRRYINTHKGRLRFDAFKLRAPLFGPLFRMIAVARFSGTLSTLLASGVPLLKAMDIVKNIVDNRIIEEAIGAARTNIAEGHSISDPLKKSGQFPPIVVHMIAIGERSGELESMLKKVSDTFENQIDSRVATMTSLLEPLMIAAMGGIVGFIVFAVMLPIFNLNQVIQ